ncbi:Hypp3462 [Branchiostoma lanceolatum]|uniref:Hypp3462 protein n=1 Tax=Branchiostoma lanceolatum TaxID=7740 RepID=A0A8K0A2B1_BRALA|nr:Hypp3462 [Branchiostoma lanceolatum]
MAFQPLNKLRPNSKSNTIVCSVFEVKDNRENVTTGTKRYAEEIKELQVTKWKSPDDTSYSIRVFAASDYALLSLWYGISGACGVHPCLWCEETKTGIRQPKSERQTCPKRTLDSLHSDHKRFLEEGQGNIKKAKNFKNVIAPPMFDIPLNQVCVPGLHISLGLFHKFFKMLEAELQDLDIILANHLTTHILLDEEVDAAEVMMDPTLHGLTKYVEAADQARILEAEAAALGEEIESCENDLAWIVYQEEDDFDEDEEDDVPIALLQQNAAALEEDIKCFLEKKEKLDKPIEDMTTIIVAIVNELVDSYDFPLGMRERAKCLQQKYEKLFKLFAACHKLYSHARPMKEEEIRELEEAIKSLMAFYRETFPTCTIPVKMHMLEDHVAEWIRKWGFGLGFHGEQGIEEIHAALNNIGRTTWGIASKTKQLQSLLYNHLIAVSPDHKGGVPAPEKRTKKD